MADNKTKPTSQSPIDFIKAIEDESKKEDSLQLLAMFRRVTGEPGEMWGASIVGFGRYKYTYASGRSGEWMQVGFSPRKSALTLYIATGFSEYAERSGFDAAGYLSKLGPHKTGKACLYIKRLSDINIDVLEQLVAASYSQSKKHC